MAANRTHNRRSFLGRIVGVAAATGALATLIGPAHAQTYTGVTDCDGQNAEGYGRGQRNQFTDADSGPDEDVACHGRGGRSESSRAPTGQGAYGNEPSYCSDQDRGGVADPYGRGIHCTGVGRQSPRNPPSNTHHCSDSDPVDPYGSGIHCQ